MALFPGDVVDGKLVVFFPPRQRTNGEGAGSLDGGDSGRRRARAGESDGRKPLSPAKKRIAEQAQVAALVTAAANGVPFCAECEKAQQELDAAEHEAANP